MNEDNIPRLIVGSLFHQLTAEEQQVLDDWLTADRRHRQLYDSLLKDTGKELAHMRKLDSRAAYKAMKARLAQAEDQPLTPAEDHTLTPAKGSHRLRFLRWFSTAAAILIVIGAAYFISHHNDNERTVAIVRPTQMITHGSTKAFVYLDDGQRIDLGSNLQADAQAMSRLSSGDYDGKVTIRTPRGGEFALTLPDSSQVWLNSESSISYPTAFKGDLRQVAVTGEAYFKVRHHAQWPFEVTTAGQTVRVLGTEFNINAYDAGHVYTTLFKGSVAVRATGSSHAFVLTPGQTSDFSVSTKSFDNNTVDTTVVRGWLHGRFVFENQPLGSIMKELSRWYDFDYTFADRTLTSTVFMGSVPRYGDFREVLRILEMSGGIKFRQRGRKITVEKK